ncbi:MAG: ABC transporter substrate-binding protein, partial [Aestuariivirgaceae bacterium]
MTENSRLDDLIRQPKIRRREFIQYAMAAGVTASVAGSMFDKAQAATPKKGGHYVQAITGGANTDVLDPAQTLDSYMINVSFGQLRNNLTEIAPDGQIAAELCESWEASPDASTWTFKLRKGVEFHNGKSFEAADVIASFNHHRGEDTKSAAKGLTKQIKDVKADGKDTVVFVLSGGNADWPFIVSDYHIPICPAKDDGTIDWQSGVGTGGYKLEKFDPGVNTQVSRNSNYWKEGRAFFDSIENVFVADATARTNGVRTGSIHSMSNLDLKTVHLLQKDPGVQVFPITGNKHAVFPMFTDVAPFDNVDVRLALKWAVKREELVKKILRGQGELGNDTPIGPANIYRATPEELPQREYDPDKAKAHLKKAGMEGLSVKIHLADTAFEGALDAGQLFVESAKAAGINLTIVREADD